MRTLPKHARAVIIGVGVAGASVAYHLAKLGWKDVVLLERKRHDMARGRPYWPSSGQLKYDPPRKIFG